jgi:hypothetical protein
LEYPLIQFQWDHARRKRRRKRRRQNNSRGKIIRNPFVGQELFSRIAKVEMTSKYESQSSPLWIAVNFLAS